MNISKYVELVQKIADALASNGIDLDMDSLNKKQAVNEIGMETDLTKSGMIKAIKDTIGGRQLSKLQKDGVSFEYDTYSKDGDKFPLLIASIEGDCSIEFTFDHITESVEIQVLAKAVDDEDLADFQEEDGGIEEEEVDELEENEEGLPMIELKTIRAKMKKHSLVIPAKPNSDGEFVIELGDMERKEFYPIFEEVMINLGAESSRDEEKNYCFTHDGGVYALVCKKVKGTYIAYLWEKKGAESDEDETPKQLPKVVKEQKSPKVVKEQKVSPVKELIVATNKALSNNAKAFALMAQTSERLSNAVAEINEAAKLMNEAARYMLD